MPKKSNNKGIPRDTPYTYASRTDFRDLGVDTST